MRLKHTLQAKLLGCCVVLMAVALIGSVSSAWMIHQVGSDMDRCVNVAAEKLDAVGDFSTSMDRIRIAGRQVLAYGLFHKPEIVEQEIHKVELAKPQFDAALVRVERVFTSPNERSILEQVHSLVGPWYSNIQNTNALCRAGQPEAGAAASQKNGRAVSTSLDRIRIDLLGLARQELRVASEEARAARTLSYWMIAFGVLLTLATAAAIVVIIQRMNQRLQCIAADVAAGAESIKGAVSQLSCSSGLLSSSASEHAAALEESSSSVEEISSIARRNAAGAAEATSLVGSVDVRLQDGDRAVKAMIQSMDDIGASSARVSKIIKVIDEIAFQTNILALNAAVEAARAGEAGLGFAVVADEVRNLAQRCAQAAKDTAELIEESLSKSKSGRDCVEQVNGVFREISANAGKVSTLIQDVTAGSEEQATGMGQIAEALSQMSQTTQAIAATAEESAAATSEMGAQARTLEAAVGSLKELVG